MIGHRAGTRAVNLCIDFCIERGIAALTLFAFSSENWGRPADEVGALMKLFLNALDREVAELHRRGVCVRFIGERARFDAGIIARMDAAEALKGEGTAARVVSMPCMEIFREQDRAYRDRVLTPGVKRVAIEAAAKAPWYEWVGLDGAVIGMDTFGASAPAEILFEKFGFSVENVVKVVKETL